MLDSWPLASSVILGKSLCFQEPPLKARDVASEAFTKVPAHNRPPRQGYSVTRGGGGAEAAL